MLEREVENLLEQKLKKNEWIVDVGEINRNVYRQQPRSIDEINDLKILGIQKFPDFILYQDRNIKECIAIIETKRPEHKNLETAKDQGMMYAKALKAKFLFLYNANRFISYQVSTGKNLYIDGDEVNDIIPLSILQKFNSNTLSLHNEAQIKSKSDLINLFKIANAKLREAGVNAGVSRFAEFSNLLFLKLISELNENRNYNISKIYLWNQYRDLPGDMLLKYLNETVIPGLNKKFDTSEELNPLFTKLKIKDVVKLKEIIVKLDTLNLSKIDTDIKGDAFEYFIQKYNQTNNDLGEYFTPRHIVKFLNDIANPQFGEKIYDPFCGTGGMLIVAFERIYQHLLLNGMLDDENLSYLREQSIYGREISETSRIAKMNMILSGDGHSHISQMDTFANPINNKFDVVISNIPFNMNITQTIADLYEPIVKSGNGVAIIHILNSLKEKSTKSRACVIVPESVLNERNLKILREKIVSSGQLIGIVSLPSKVFLPYTEAKTSILIFGSKNNTKTENIFIYKVENDGFTLTSRRRNISGINDLDNFISIHNEMLQSGYNDILQYQNLFYVKRKNILKNTNKSLLLSQYCDDLKPGYIRLNDILEITKTKNIERFPTASITKSEFWGMPLGEDLWGDNFLSVTSEDNSNYTVVKPKYLSFNPARANVGSFGINMSLNNVSVSSAYPVFKIKSNLTKEYLAEYVFLEIKYSSVVQEDISSRAYGTIRQSLSTDEFLKLQIKKLSFNEQKNIVEKTIKKFKKYETLKNELENFKMD